MKTYVCVKHAADSAVLADGGLGERDRYLNPYDLHAVEAAVELAAWEDAEVVAVTVGGSEATAALERAVAMGVDRGVHVVVERPLDAILTARGLAAAIRRDGGGDLVFTGCKSVDTQGSQVPYRLAALLGWRAANDVASLTYEDGVLTVGREGESHQVPLPCVVGVGKALNNPRDPTLPQILRARRQGVETVDWDTLEIEAPEGGTEVLDLRPAVARRRGVILEGDPEEAVAELLRRLRGEARVL